MPPDILVVGKDGGAMGYQKLSRIFSFLTPRRLAPDNSGLTSLEFVMISPLAMALFLGGVELSSYAQIRQQIVDASRQAARKLATQTSPPTDSTALATIFTANYRGPSSPNLQLVSRDVTWANNNSLGMRGFSILSRYNYIPRGVAGASFGTIPLTVRINVPWEAASASYPVHGTQSTGNYCPPLVVPQPIESFLLDPGETVENDPCRAAATPTPNPTSVPNQNIPLN